MGKVLFDNEHYDLTQYPDGSKTLFKERNRKGFKITIHVSGNKQEHEEGMNAVKDFFVKGNNL